MIPDKKMIVPQTRLHILQIKTPLSIIVIKDNWEKFDSLSNCFLKTDKKITARIHQATDKYLLI